MGRIFDKMLKAVLSFVLVFSSLMLVTPMQTVEVQAAETTYEIYPTPHKVNYTTGSFIMRKEVNVVYENGIDQATKNHLETVLKSKDKTVTVGTSKVEGKTNILVGIKGSNEYVDTYAAGKYAADLFTEKHFGAYYFSTTNDEVVILGADTDAAFYGVTTLKQIFNQIDGSELRYLTMEDYADVNIRGFIEGYYGIPWSNQDRMELMKFGGDIKMTSYIFAPKNDPYHKELWREKYPEKELAELKEMVDVGNATKCRFVWTAHPFMGGFKAHEADQEIQRLIDKFEHLYNDANVRQFGVLGDDVGNLDKAIVVKMMKEVGKWAASKPDVKDVVFCPGGYNHSWQGDYTELNIYDEGFPSNIQIFWTGEAVCQPIEQKTLEHFRRHNSNHHGERRAPLFWLNWPVNDINHSRMLMGDGSRMLNTNITIDDLAGAVTNPMQESEPSKVAIFQLADYSWNVKAFNGNKCWKDSFKYIDAEATKELYELAKHMADPSPNGHGLWMPEDVELSPKLDALKNALNQGNYTKEQLTQMIAEFEVIIAACDGFNVKSKNAEMKKDLAPYIASLKDLCEANINFLNARIALDANDNLGAYNLYTAGQNELKASQNHRKPMLGGGTEAVDPGSQHLIPFAKHLEKHLSKPMSDFIAGGEAEVVKITAESNISNWWNGNPNNIIDGRNDTQAWASVGEQVGQYFQVNFSKPQTVYGVHIINGVHHDNAEKHRDTFAVGKVMIKVNGQWSQIGENFTDYPEFVDINQVEYENVEAVRYECVQTTSANKWPSMREFRVSTTPENANDFTKTPIKPLPDGWSASDGDLARMVDDDPNSAVHFNVRQRVPQEAERNRYKVGDFYGVNLNKTITLGKINIIQDGGNDKFHASKLQYLAENGQWTDLEGATFGNVANITFDASDLNIKAKGVRLVATDSQPFWVKVYEFDVDSKVFFNARAYTNVVALKDVRANVFNENANLQPRENITLQPGEFIGLKLDRIHEITSIVNTNTANGLTLEVGKNEYEFTTYNGGVVDARYIRLINNTNGAVTFNISELSTSHKEFYPKSFMPKESSGFRIYQNRNHLAVFDGDWTTNTHFEGSQHLGNKFVYDLGQEIDFNQFKVVCRDSEHDYPRHAKFSVSTDLVHWEDILLIGNQTGDNPGEAANQDNILDVLTNHETSYNTLEAKNINKKGRYLKFEITRRKSGDDKWVRFQEFIINEGAYVPEINNPTFESNCTDTLGGEYANLLDSDLATMFIPNKDTGKLTYHLSEKNDVNVVKIVQAATPNSHAVVKARVLGQTEPITLGTLSQTVNEFVLPVDTKILDVTIEWNGVVPNIAELILSQNTEVTTVTKDRLVALINTLEDTSNWTKDSKATYDVAIENAKKVNASTHVSQETVDGAIKAIETAIANKELKGDVAVLQAKLDTKMTDAKVYTVASWREYQVVIGTLEAAIKDADNTSEQDVTRLASEYDAALAALVYSPLKAEEATLAVMDMEVAVEKLTAENYTTDSWQALQTTIATLKATLEGNKTTKVHPNEIATQLEAMNSAYAGLVNVSTLKDAIATFEATDSTIYTEKSYNAYKAVVDGAKELLTNGTNETIKKAVEDINKAKNELVVKGDFASVQALYDQLAALKEENYTTDSFNALQTTLTEVQALGNLADLSQEQLDQVSAKLQAANNGLVNVQSLKASIAAAKTYEEKYFTADSYKVLADALLKAEPLLVNGTQADVDAMVNVIDEAIRGLKTKADKEAIDAYLQGIEFDTNKDKYTEDSYKAYKDAYDKLVEMSNNNENVTKEEFFAACEAFELAQKQLTLKDVHVDGQVNTGDKNDAKGPMMIAGGAIVAMGIIGFVLYKKKKDEE